MGVAAPSAPGLVRGHADRLPAEPPGRPKDPKSGSDVALTMSDQPGDNFQTISAAADAGHIHRVRIHRLHGPGRSDPHCGKLGMVRASAP